MTDITQHTKTPIDSEQLLAELNNSVDLQATATSIEVDGSDVTINWNQTPTAGELTDINTIVDAHVPVIDDVGVNTLPYNVGRLAVHSSSKPQIEGKVLYDTFIGRGDDVVNHVLGGGELATFDFELNSASPINVRTETVDFFFDPLFGGVYLHGGYMTYTGAGVGDFLSAYVVASGSVVTTLLPSPTLTVDVDGWVRYEVASPSTATHSFAANPSLIPRTFSQDGDWDYDGVNLTPNFSQNGLYKINTNDTTVSHYINSVPLLGDSNGHVDLESAEAAQVPAGYYIHVIVTNASGNKLQGGVIAHAYRERTYQP